MELALNIVRFIGGMLEFAFLLLYVFTRKNDKKVAYDYIIVIVTMLCLALEIVELVMYTMLGIINIATIVTIVVLIALIFLEGRHSGARTACKKIFENLENSGADEEEL